MEILLQTLKTLTVRFSFFFDHVTYHGKMVHITAYTVLNCCNKLCNYLKKTI